MSGTKRAEKLLLAMGNRDQAWLRGLHGVGKAALLPITTSPSPGQVPPEGTSSSPQDKRPRKQLSVPTWSPWDCARCVRRWWNGDSWAATAARMTGASYPERRCPNNPGGHSARRYTEETDECPHSVHRRLRLGVVQPRAKARYRVGCARCCVPGVPHQGFNLAVP
jgi:hypothetical protein